MKLNRVTISGVNTFKLPVLSQAENQALFTQIQTGSQEEALEAKQELVQGNLKLVLSVLKRFKNRGESLDDLFQVGCVGLLKAVENFDSGQGVKFSTYAVPMIMGEIKRYLRDDNPLRVSRNMRYLGQKALQVKEELQKASPHEPTMGEIAQKMGIDPEELARALNSVVEPVSLYETVHTDSTDPLLVMDQIEDKTHDFEHYVDNMALREALSKLPERERSIVCLRFFQGKTQTEVSEAMGISQAQVSRLEKSALLNMRGLMREWTTEEGRVEHEEIQ